MVAPQEVKMALDEDSTASHDETQPASAFELHKKSPDGVVLVPQPSDDPLDPLVSQF